ncbi:hypothetical protein D3C85_1648370 [compost metagenome]
MLVLFVEPDLCSPGVNMEVLGQLGQARAYVLGIADQIDQRAEHTCALRQAVLQSEQSVDRAASAAHRSPQSIEGTRRLCSTTVIFGKAN